jgi:SAM-dependent methyltransferase
VKPEERRAMNTDIWKQSDAVPGVNQGSPDRFGYEWQNYSEILPEHERQFLGWTAHLKPEDWRDKTFLDVGCGMGRNSYWPLKYGASDCIAIDVDSRSLASARRTLAAFPNATVCEKSAYDTGYHERFDIVFSIGVIHHLEFPERALQAMVEAAKPGGRVLIWVYGLENNEWIVKFLTPLRKAMFSRLPIGLVHHLSIYPAVLVWAAVRLGFQPIEYFRLLRGLSFRNVRSIVFDQMLPKIANYWSRGEVEALMGRAGLQDIRLVWVNEMSWSAIGVRPGLS